MVHLGMLVPTIRRSPRLSLVRRNDPACGRCRAGGSWRLQGCLGGDEVVPRRQVHPDGGLPSGGGVGGSGREQHSPIGTSGESSSVAALCRFNKIIHLFIFSFLLSLFGGVLHLRLDPIIFAGGEGVSERTACSGSMLQHSVRHYRCLRSFPGWVG